LLTESKDAEERAEAMKCVNDGLGGPFAKYAAQTLYMVAGSKAVEDKERGYAHPMDFRNKANRNSGFRRRCPAQYRHDAGWFADAAILQIESAPFGSFRSALERSPCPDAVCPYHRDSVRRAADIVATSYESFQPHADDDRKELLCRPPHRRARGKGKAAWRLQFVPRSARGKTVSYTLMNYLGSTMT